MTTTNIWQKFKALIPEGSRTIVTITANNGNGTSQVQLRDGSVVTVKGESVQVGQKAFIQSGEIKGTAPELAQYEVEV
ncbi:hypothetical protein [Endozoicomonas sp. Mp262]|uniref:hypothetical protein n=1 Tax=Endozoicomonas sp. Mp262 TaxID=2919499 RepID=UPI0021DA76AD